jgi:coatomer protein complex subunit alpha (xenin)
MRSFEGHNDWVNDLVLYKQYLISCSSDQSICLWNTMNTTHPVRLGIHNDYVKRLAQPKHQNWVVSGSLDQSISIWDLSETRPNDPMSNYN